MNPKVLFLRALLAKTKCLEEVLDFLLASKAITPDQIHRLKNESDISLSLHTLLQDCVQQDKLLLLDYEWQILPVERLRLFIVTEFDKREFSFNN